MSPASLPRAVLLPCTSETIRPAQPLQVGSLVHDHDADGPRRLLAAFALPLTCAPPPKESLPGAPGLLRGSDDSCKGLSLLAELTSMTID